MKRMAFKAVKYAVDGVDAGQWYEVSKSGEVRSKQTKRIIYIDDRGTSQKVKLSVEGKTKNVPVHQLVLFTWGGVSQEEYKARRYDTHHLDGNPRNNKLKNLVALPHDKHMMFEGSLRALGAKKKHYTEEDKRKILEMYKHGYSNSAIERETGISYKTINNITREIN